MKILEYFGLVVLGLLMVALVSVFLALPTMWLWNWLMPDLFGFPLITIWQALGLSILARFLFGTGSSSSSSSK